MIHHTFSEITFINFLLKTSRIFWLIYVVAVFVRLFDYATIKWLVNPSILTHADTLISVSKTLFPQVTICTQQKSIRKASDQLEEAKQIQPKER